MKKMFAVVICMALCFSLLSVGSVAETEGDFEYTVVKGKATITEYIGSATEVTIPSTLGGVPVTAIGESAFYYESPGIGSNITSLHIPETVTTIEHSALYGCDAVTVYTVSPKNPAFQVVDGVLFSKDGKTLVRYPAGRTNTTYTIPHGVTTIESYAFANCDNFTSMEIPQGVTTICDRGFYDCDNLAAINFSDSVTFIGDAAFFGCPKLASLTIPASVLTIGEYAFEYCRGISTLSIGAGATKGNTVIGKYAFASCSGLTTVVIGGNVTTVGNHAFYWCDNLENLTLEEGVTTLEEGAFANCSGLASVTFPGSVTTIEKAAFYYCDSLTTVTIPESITTIGKGAFAFVTDGCLPPAPMEGFVIKGVAGSAAETYALENEIPFEVITQTDIPETPTDVPVTPTDLPTLGDINGDTKIDAKDALDVLKFAVNKIKLTQKQQVAADVNKDTKVDAKDALEILKYAVNKPSVLQG